MFHSVCSNSVWWAQRSSFVHIVQAMGLHKTSEGCEVHYRRFTVEILFMSSYSRPWKFITQSLSTAARLLHRHYYACLSSSDSNSAACCNCLFWWLRGDDLRISGCTINAMQCSHTIFGIKHSTRISRQIQKRLDQWSPVYVHPEVERQRCLRCALGFGNNSSLLLQIYCFAWSSLLIVWILPAT